VLRPLSLLVLLGCGPGLIDGESPDGAPPVPDASPGPDAEVAEPGCPARMARVQTFCIDRWEAYVVELDGETEIPHPPTHVVDDLIIRAKTAPGVKPQGYISQVQAAAACANAGKRLCSATEFDLACRHDPASYYPYGGTTKEPGACNEGKGSAMVQFYPDTSTWTYAAFNDPRLNEWAGGLANTGTFTGCVTPRGIADLVGNLHEWGSDVPDSDGNGRFRGGFYGDAEVNGPGCLYVTRRHGPTYHDYSTGFRCCQDATP
jgi:formylglycine-generating enzyme